nr:glycosyltransferase family 39 protein [Rhodococcus sp. D2-41]
MGLSRRGWERAGLVLLLAGTAVTYLWNITVNGMGNQFYAAAAQAGSTNWEALLFGSLDTGNFITVDKPPLSQWVMGLSGQIFGFSSASMLIPQALMAVAAVALLYGAITRIAGRGAGLLAGTALALTPVAALMFRFNNPDAVMVLAMTAAVYATLRALPKASAKWIALAGVALGLAFLAKMLEGLMVLPALGLAYLIVAPTTLGKRLLHLLGAAAALTAASGWYILITLIWPADTRPYLAGSTDNNFMNLVLGYNGLARILGRNHGGGHAMPHFKPPADLKLPDGLTLPHHGGHGGFGAGSVGLTRLFGGELGFEISWLLPVALLAFVLVLVSRGRRPRTDLVRGAALVFGLWLIVDGIVFSYMNGMFHAYYTLAIAPAIAGLVGLGVHEMWSIRDRRLGRFGLAALVLAGGVWGFVLLQRNSSWLPWLRWVLLAVTVIAAVGLALGSIAAVRRFSAVFLALGVVGILGGSAAYTFATVPVSHTGGSPTVGPARKDGDQFAAFAKFFGGSESNPRLDAMLAATHTKWSAAIDRSSPAAALELSSNTAVMAIGGFMDDPTPTLGQFIDYVKNHQVTYYVVENRGLPTAGKPADDAAGHPAQATPAHRPTGHGKPADAQAAPAHQGPAAGGWMSGFGGHTDITNWVAAHFKPVTVGSATVYDMSHYEG